MKRLLKLIYLIFEILLKLSFFSLKAFWFLSVYVLSCIDNDDDGYDDEQVIFSYRDDDSGDPNNTTVTGKSYTPGQSIPLYEPY
jgi:hypothetical protein